MRMPEDAYITIKQCAEMLNIAPYVEGLPRFAIDNNLNEDDLRKLAAVFLHMSELKNQAVVDTLLKMSRLPLKVPKSFGNFDFSRIHGKSVEKLTALSSLAAVQAHCNLAFIGPPGVGKTHLAMAYGRACCEKGMKSYFLKASELNQKFTEARRMDRVGSAVNFLVKPSCLIIDEIGRCKFDKENTHLFFDLIDRRYGKDGPNCMIFTSNKQPDSWAEYFTKDSTLLCTLDRIFDEASVFIFKGDSFRGQKTETIRLEAGAPSATTN